MSELEIEERVTGNPDVVVDYKNAIIDNNTMILHHTSVCQSKYYKAIRWVGYYGKAYSQGEIVKRVFMDNFD